MVCYIDLGDRRRCLCAIQNLCNEMLRFADIACYTYGGVTFLYFYVSKSFFYSQLSSYYEKIEEEC